MELTEGMYVRYEGNINKIMKIVEDKVLGKVILLDKYPAAYVEYELEGLKVSHNIIDLIEEGDYVNGSKLLSIDYAEDFLGNCDKLHFYYSFEDSDKDINEYNDRFRIYSIVTKEQFESMEYRIGE